MMEPTLKHSYPDQVTLIEVGPRDGFQFESKIIPTPLKVEIISGLVAAGLKQIQVTSFVHPQRVPQMADAESLLRALPVWENVELSGLVLNREGWNGLAVPACGRWKYPFPPATPTVARTPVCRWMKRFSGGRRWWIWPDNTACMCGPASSAHSAVCMTVQSTPQRVVDMARAFIDQGAAALALADTTGMADPLSIRRMVTEVQRATGETSLILHLHDTRGLGLVNLMAGLECGVTRFDTALAGMGGCPFVAGAAGNIATEDTVYLLDRLQVKTGISIRDVAACSIKLEKFYGKRFAGKMVRLAR